MKVLGMKMTVKNMIILFFAALGVVYVFKCCCDQGRIGMELMSCGKKKMVLGISINGLKKRYC